MRLGHGLTLPSLSYCGTQALCTLLIGSYFLIKLPGMGELLALVPDKCVAAAK